MMKGNRLWVLGAVASIAIIVVVGWLLGISPKLAEADTAAREQQSVDALNATQAAEIATLKEQEENLDDLRDDLEELRAAIPDAVLADDFIDQISAAATTAGVTVTRISFAPPGAWGLAASAEGAPTTTSEPGSESPPVPTAPEGVYTVGVTIEVLGLSVNVGYFSQLLQEGNRLFLLPSLGYEIEKTTGTLNGYLFVIRDSTAPPPEAVSGSEGGADEEPEPSETPEPTESPTPTPTPSP
jgi:hypothetical protein